MKLSVREIVGLIVGILGIAMVAVAIDAKLVGRAARWYDDVILMGGLPTMIVGGAIGNSRLVGGVLMGGGFLFGGVALLVKALSLTSGPRLACFIMAGGFIPLGLLFSYLQFVVARREEKTRRDRS